MRIDGVAAGARQQFQEADVLALIRARAAAAHPGGATGVDRRAPPKANDAPSAKTSPTQLDTALQQVNDKLKVLGTDLHFEVDKDSALTLVKVVDRDSGEVLRQIPSEAAVRIARSLDQIVGHLVNHRA